MREAVKSASPHQRLLRSLMYSGLNLLRVLVGCSRGSRGYGAASCGGVSLCSEEERARVARRGGKVRLCAGLISKFWMGLSRWWVNGIGRHFSKRFGAMARSEIRFYYIFFYWHPPVSPQNLKSKCSRDGWLKSNEILIIIIDPWHNRLSIFIFIKIESKSLRRYHEKCAIAILISNDIYALRKVFTAGTVINFPFKCAQPFPGNPIISDLPRL